MSNVLTDVLTSNPAVADALVDMSNIVRDQRLGGRGEADLGRLRRVWSALADLYNDASVRMFGVADESLLDRPGMFLDPTQRRTLHDEARSGLFLVTGKADAPLLQIAHETGLPIITRDKFVGHRREFPWLDGSDDAVLEPKVDRHGGVSLSPVALESRKDWQLSIKEEEDLLVQQGLKSHVGALDRLWSCPEPRCPRHDPKNAPYVLLPRGVGGRLVCDQHRLDMVDMGPRPRATQLKIMLDGKEWRRLTVSEDEPVTIGRSPGPGDLSEAMDEDALRGVSREHLCFEMGNELTVTDTSRNGTVLILRDGAHVDLHQASHPFTVRDRARIRPGLEIIRSGRRYPSELPNRRRGPELPGGDPPPAPTTLL
jgi:hypothetical protein